MKYTKWLVDQFGSNATPSRPPSPFVVTTFGTVPMSVLVPPVVLSLYTRNCPLATLSSRSVTNADCPSGAKYVPHGMVQPVEYLEMLDGTPPLQALVVNDTVLLCADTLPARSRATTFSVYAVLQARLVTEVEVAGGLPV